MRPPRAHLLALVAMLLVLLGPAPAEGTRARFSDSAPVTSGAFSAGTITPVTGLTCTNTGLNRITLRWNAQPNRVYQLQVFQGSVRRISVITSQSTVELNVGNLDLLQSGRHRVTVTTLLTSTGSWVAASSPEVSFDAVLGLSLRCA